MCVCVPPFLVHSSVDRHLGCFHILAIANKDAMNINVQICFKDSAFNSELELLNNMVILLLIF